MKNQTNQIPPKNNRRFPTTKIRRTREAYRLMPKAPHHDLLVLSFYPGMDAKEVHAGHPTAA
jgi:hypothetical protein